MTTEVNRFRWPGPDLRPIAADRPGQFAFGGLPEKLMRQVIERMVSLHRDRRLRMVSRESEM